MSKRMLKPRIGVVSDIIVGDTIADVIDADTDFSSPLFSLPFHQRYVFLEDAVKILDAFVQSFSKATRVDGRVKGIDGRVEGVVVGGRRGSGGGSRRRQRREYSSWGMIFVIVIVVVVVIRLHRQWVGIMLLSS